MTRITKFSDAFWGTDYCSTAGFDTLCKRMKEARQTSKDFLDFLKQRAKIEQEYSTALQKLASNSAGKEEVGTLRSSFDSLKTEMESIAKHHQEASQAIYDQASRLETVMVQQKENRKKTEDSVKKLQQNKKSQHKKVFELKKSYEDKCRGADQAEIEYSQGCTANLLPKDIAKLSQKTNKTKTEAKKAEQCYKDAVDDLEVTRKTWETEMCRACEVFQQDEESRIHFMRNELWVFTNIGSHFCVEVDECLDKIRQSLEKCDIDHDIVLVATERQTGTQKPDSIFYEDFYQVGTRHNSDSLSARPPLPLPRSPKTPPSHLGIPHEPTYDSIT